MSRIQEASRSLDVALDAQQLRAGVEQKRASARSRKRKLAAAALLVAMIAAVWVALPSRSNSADSSAAGAPTPAAARPGLETSPLTRDAHVVTVVDEPRRAELLLERGGVRFVVDPQRERTVTVRARFVTVEVVGTIFEIEHVSEVAV
jgi:ferric-dicitrate binding protein FerR (iron transport regulator)